MDVAPPLMNSSGLLPTGSLLESLIQISNEVSSMEKIPTLSLLKIAADTREQVELLHKQVKRVDLLVDCNEIQRRDELLQVMMSSSSKSSKSKGITDFGKVKVIMTGIGLKTPLDYEEEISKLEAEAEKQAGTGGLIVVSNINNLISLVSLSKAMVFNKEDHKIAEGESTDNNSPLSYYPSSQSMIINIPDEYRCPISLDLMRDPVIVASGHTYDRVSIAQWINSGHHTCPKSGQRLIHMALIPNYALKSLIHQFCQENNIPLTDPESSSSSSSHLERTPSMKRKLPSLQSLAADGSMKAQRKADALLRLLNRCCSQSRSPFFANKIIANRVTGIMSTMNQ